MSDPGWRAWASEHRIDLVLFAFSLFYLFLIFTLLLIDRVAGGLA